MPLYEYQCQKCGSKFERFVRGVSLVGEEKTVQCPNCGHAEAKRLVSLCVVSDPARRGKVFYDSPHTTHDG